MLSVQTPNKSSSAVVRYQRSATCSSLEGSHNRPITRTATTSAQLTASRPRGNKPPSNSSSLSECHSTHPSHTAPKLLERSSRTASSRTAAASTGAFDSNKQPCELSPACPEILRASTAARARPSASSSPSCATASCRTLRPRRTERTSCQYTCALPSLCRVVCRRYMKRILATPYACGNPLGRHYTRFLTHRAANRSPMACIQNSLQRETASWSPRHSDRKIGLSSNYCGSWPSSRVLRAVPANLGSES